MWGMEHAKSDLDLTKVYAVSAEDFLISRGLGNSHFSQVDGVDTQSHEIGKIISLLKKMNVNAIWAVMSPLVLEDRQNLIKQLKQIVTDNKSKQVYWSVQGMARNNIRKFIVNGDKKSDKYRKKLNTIARTIQFATNYYLYGKFIFEKTAIKTKQELDSMMLTMQMAFDSSAYPGQPDPEPFDKFLRKVRLYVLRKELDLNITPKHH